MALAEGQVQVRNLVLGPGTPYTLLGFNPFNRSVRAEQTGPRAWNDGSWSGAEFLEESVVNFDILTTGASRNAGAWLTEHFELMAAFDAVGESGADVELKFMLGGNEYVMLGRPRMLEPDTTRAGIARVQTSAAFVANDPRIYSGTETTVTMGLAQYLAGLTAPFTVPTYVRTTKVGGESIAVNAGNAQTALHFRIDGEVSTPSILLKNPDGEVSRLNVTIDIESGQFLTVSTASRLVLLDGISNRRGQVHGDFPTLKPGTSTILFHSPDYSSNAKLTATWRSAW